MSGQESHRHRRVQLPFGFAFGHSRFGRDSNPEGVSRTGRIAGSHSPLLAHDFVGGAGVVDVRPELVGDVRTASATGLEVPGVRDCSAPNNLDLTKPGLSCRFRRAVAGRRLNA